MKVVRGTDRADRRSANEPEPDRGIPKCPAHFNGRAKEAWKRIGPMLDRMGVLTQADGAALELLCDAYADYRDASEVIRVSGSTYTTTTQQGDTMYRPRPEVAMRNDAWRRVASMASEFGLNPSSRSKVSASPEGDDDEARFFGAG